MTLKAFANGVYGLEFALIPNSLHSRNESVTCEFRKVSELMVTGADMIKE